MFFIKWPLPYNLYLVKRFLILVYTVIQSSNKCCLLSNCTVRIAQYLTPVVFNRFQRHPPPACSAEVAFNPCYYATGTGSAISPIPLGLPTAVCNPRRITTKTGSGSCPIPLSLPRKHLPLDVIQLKQLLQPSSNQPQTIYQLHTSKQLLQINYLNILYS